MVVTASADVQGMTSSSLSTSGLVITSVTTLAAGRQYSFEIVPDGTGYFDIWVAAGSVSGASGIPVASGSNTLSIYHDITPPSPKILCP